MKHFRNFIENKRNIVLFTFFAFFTIISCSPAKQDSKQTQQVPVMPPTQEQSSPVNNEPAQPIQNEPTAQTPAEQNNAEVMLNPPHGEPYHRCDIPVGAPLNSAPANTARQTTNSPASTSAPRISGSAPSVANNPTAPTIENAQRMNSGQTRSTAQTNNNTGTKPRLNPAHGQPWHRCDIPVGSPLP